MIVEGKLLYGSREAAGLDLFASETITLVPGHKSSYHTGVRVEFPEGYFGLICGRSSLGREGIVVLGGVIDNDYRGEIIVMLCKITIGNYTIREGDRIAQMILLPYQHFPLVMGVPGETERGSQGFGSTGK